MLRHRVMGGFSAERGKEWSGRELARLASLRQSITVNADASRGVLLGA